MTLLDHLAHGATVGLEIAGAILGVAFVLAVTTAVLAPVVLLAQHGVTRAVAAWRQRQATRRAWRQHHASGRAAR